MVSELEALRLAGISVFVMALSHRADDHEVRGISSVPQLINRNYFISRSIATLNSFSTPLSTQVSYSVNQVM